MLLVVGCSWEKHIVYKVGLVSSLEIHNWDVEIKELHTSSGGLEGGRRSIAPEVGGRVASSGLGRTGRRIGGGGL